DLLDLADDERRDVMALAERTTSDDLVRLHQGFSTGFDDVVRSGQPRAALEMLLVRMARRPALIPVDELVARLSALEKRLGGGAPRGGPSVPPAGRPGGGAAGGRPESRPTGAAPLERSASREARTASPPAESARPARSDDPPRARSPEGATERGAEGTPVEQGVPLPAAINPVIVRARADGVANGSREAPADNGAALATFRSIVDRVRAVRPELAAFLNHAVVVRVDSERLVVAFEAGSVFERNVRAPDAVSALQEAVNEHFRTEVTLTFETTVLGNGSGSVATVASQDSQERADKRQAQLDRAKGHPMIAQAVEILGGRLKEIRLPSD
ncbi:MAG TPA: hypothetical protein VF395_16245, partial [Polyangiaceae bacterium]